MTMNIQELKKHKFIVFCRDHNNPLGMCWSLAKEGISPIVVLIGEKPSMVNHSNCVREYYQFNTLAEGFSFIVNSYKNEPFKPFLLTGQDELTEYVDQHYNEIKDFFYTYNDGAQGAITFNNQKDVQCRIAEECGIHSPKGVVLKKGEVPQGLRYPIFTKVTMATRGAWKQDVHICKNEKELTDAWSEIEADEMLVQEFIEKKNELCIDGFSIKGGEEIFLSYTSEYIRFSNKSFGNYMRMKKYNNEDVKNKIKSMIRKTGYSGIFCVECIIDKNEDLYFLEVNYRYSGWGYAHTYGGVNLPLLWAKSTLANKIDENSIVLRETPFTAMDEIADFSDILNHKTVSIFTWFRQFISCDCCYTYNKVDKAPFYNYLLQRVIIKIKHLLG